MIPNCYGPLDVELRHLHCTMLYFDSGLGGLVVSLTRHDMIPVGGGADVQ